MSELTHKVGDRRRHGLGDNLRRHPHPHLPRAKQPSQARVSQSSVFSQAAGYHAAATRMPRVRMGKAV